MKRPLTFAAVLSVCIALATLRMWSLAVAEAFLPNAADLSLRTRVLLALSNLSVRYGLFVILGAAVLAPFAGLVMRPKPPASLTRLPQRLAGWCGVAVLFGVAPLLSLAATSSVRVVAVMDLCDLLVVVAWAFGSAEVFALQEHPEAATGRWRTVLSSVVISVLVLVLFSWPAHLLLPLTIVVGAFRARRLKSGIATG